MSKTMKRRSKAGRCQFYRRIEKATDRRARQRRALMQRDREQQQARAS